MNVKSEYESQVMKAMLALDEKLFPQATMDEFEHASQSDIEQKKNLCPCGVQTMKRIYPVGHHLSNGWICPDHAQAMWMKGILHGSVVFDMTKP